MLKLWPFTGGLRLAARKEESMRLPLKMASLPRELAYPLVLRNGQNAKPKVAPGDRVLKGQVLAAAEGSMNPPLHASTSGRVRSIEQRPLPHPSGFAVDCLIIDADGEDESVNFHGVANYAELEPDALRALIHAAGIVGMGGAAFPTAVKIDPGRRRPIDVLVLNGAECEPYITCDDSLLRNFPRQVLGGARILMHILQVERCLVGVEEDMPQAIAALDQAKSEGDCAGIQIVPVPAIYPAGGEKQLIKVLLGREVPANGIPADVGVVCQNVGTAEAIHKAIVEGEPLISRIVTVTGKGVRQPQNLMARIGTPIAELVEQCGGYTNFAQRLILGGPMMGLALPSDDLPITKAANCVLVAGPSEVVGEKQAMPCIRCGACAYACPVNLLPQQLYWYSRSGNLERAMGYRLSDCIECGCCDVVCPSHIPLVQYFRSAKGKAAARENERRKADHARERFEARQMRKEKEKLERAESARRKRELLEKAPEIQEAMEKMKAEKAGKSAAPKPVRPDV